VFLQTSPRLPYPVPCRKPVCLRVKWPCDHPVRTDWYCGTDFVRGVSVTSLCSATQHVNHSGSCIARLRLALHGIRHPLQAQGIHTHWWRSNVLFVHLVATAPIHDALIDTFELCRLSSSGHHTTPGERITNFVPDLCQFARVIRETPCDALQKESSQNPHEHWGLRFSLQHCAICAYPIYLKAKSPGSSPGNATNTPDKITDVSSNLIAFHEIVQPTDAKPTVSIGLH
jgi:hypothetical protein